MHKENTEDGILRIFLERHGEPDFGGKKDLIYGWTDLPLSSEGRKQATEAGRSLRDIPFDRIFSSDLSRALETAKAAAAMSSYPHLTVEQERGLREMHMGEWEGLTVEEAGAEASAMFAAAGDDVRRFRTPGGETFDDLRDRAWASFCRITASCRSCRNILITAHGGTIMAVWSSLADALPSLTVRPLGYCGILVVDMDISGGSFSISDQKGGAE